MDSTISDKFWNRHVAMSHHASGHRIPSCTIRKKPHWSETDTPVEYQSLSHIQKGKHRLGLHPLSIFAVVRALHWRLRAVESRTTVYAYFITTVCVCPVYYKVCDDWLIFSTSSFILQWLFFALLAQLLLRSTLWVCVCVRASTNSSGTKIQLFFIFECVHKERSEWCENEKA